MTGAWGLPTRAEIEDRVYEIRTDYRDILEVLRWLDGGAAPELDRGERWYVAMRLFYPDFAAMPRQDWPEATRFLAELPDKAGGIFRAEQLPAPYDPVGA